jgi:lipopolysaccharide transport system ATP-binding protein
MTEKDSSYRLSDPSAAPPRALSGAVRAPEIVETIPNIDHRFGDGRAEILGIAVLDEQGRPLQLLEPNSRIVVRISARARESLPMPMVGFMLRNQLGMDFSGTNTAREGIAIAAAPCGRRLHGRFPPRLPELYPCSFSFSPAIADGPL